MPETDQVSQVHGKSLSFPHLINVMNRKTCVEDKVHKLNRLRKGRGRVKTSPSTRLVDSGSSQPHLLSQTFYWKNTERTVEEQDRENNFEREKSKWPWLCRPWRQAAISGVLHISAVCASPARQGMHGFLPNPHAHPGFTRGSDRQIQESDFLYMNNKQTENITFCYGLAAAGVNANE